MVFEREFFIYNVKVVGVVSFHFSSFLIKVLVSELPTTIPKPDFFVIYTKKALLCFLLSAISKASYKAGGCGNCKCKEKEK